MGQLYREHLGGWVRGDVKDIDAHRIAGGSHQRSPARRVIYGETHLEGLKCHTSKTESGNT